MYPHPTALKYEARSLKRAGLIMLRNAEFAWNPAMVRSLLWEAQDGRCASCDGRMTSRRRYPRDGDRDTIDHVYPQGASGRDALGNLALMHFKCNNRKGMRPPTAIEIARLEALNMLLGWPTPRPR